MRKYGREQVLFVAIGQIVFCGSFAQNRSEIWIMYVANVWEQMMNDMVIESAEKEVDERTVRRKIRSRNDLMI